MQRISTNDKFNEKLFAALRSVDVNERKKR